MHRRTVRHAWPCCSMTLCERISMLSSCMWLQCGIRIRFSLAKTCIWSPSLIPWLLDVPVMYLRDESAVYSLPFCHTEIEAEDQTVLSTSASVLASDQLSLALIVIILCVNH